MVLLAAGPAAPFLPGRVARWAMPLLCPAGLGLAVAALLNGGGSLALGPLVWAADGLSAWMALPLLLLGAVAPLHFATLLGTLLLALLAADAISFALAVAASAAALRIRDPAVLAWAGLLLLAMLLPLLHGGPRFDALRAQHAALPGAAAGAVLVLGALAALAWRPAPHTALLSTIPLYALARLLLDLCGPAAPGWIAAPVIAAGLACAVGSGLRLAVGRSLQSATDAGTLATTGLACAGFGAALAARSADLPPLAALALGSSLLLLLASAASLGLLQLGIHAIHRAAGSTDLGQLGGVLSQMPVTGGSVLLATAGLSGLPPFAGFAGLFLLLQALLAAPRIGGLGVQLGFAAALAASGLAVALIAAGWLRLAGLAVLGPARSAAIATVRDPGRMAGFGMAALAALSLLPGLLPGVILALARPVLRPLTGADQIDAPLYEPLLLALLLAAAGAAAVGAIRPASGPAARPVPAWEGGLPAAPADGAAYAPGLLAAVPRPSAPRWPGLRTWLGMAAAALVLLLAGLAGR